MKRLLPVFALSGIVLTLTSGLALAQVNLSWDDCGSAGAADKTFACAANTGSELLYMSCVVPSGVVNCTGEQGVVDLISATDPLPAWWQFIQSGSCRTNNIQVQYITACASAFDYFGSIGTGPLGGFGYDWGASLANPATLPGYGARTDAARIRTVSAVDGSISGPITAGTEIYIATINIKNGLTTGAGSCAGCTTPVCIVYNSQLLSQPVGVGDVFLTGAPAGGRDFVTWQGGAGANCATVPTKNTTWGKVKTLYR